MTTGSDKVSEYDSKGLEETMKNTPCSGRWRKTEFPETDMVSATAEWTDPKK